MAAIAGLRGTGDWGTDERPKNFRETILWLQPNGTSPINALLAKTGKQSLDDPEFSWWEEELGLIQIVLDDATDMSNSDTAVVCDSGALELVVGDLLMVQRLGTEFDAAYAAEIVEVGAVTDDTNFTIVRAAAGSTAAIIEDNSTFVRVGSAFAEGTDAPDSASRNPDKKVNFAEIFKTTYDITRTAKQTRARTGDVVANDKKRKMFTHSTGLEMSWLFGKSDESVGANGKPLRTTGGLTEFLAAASRIIVRGGTYANINALYDDLADVFDYTGEGSTGGDERMLLCGNGAMNSINKLAAAAGTVNFGEIVKVYGMSLTRLVTSQGSFFIKSHPLLSRNTYHTNSVFVVDFPGLKYRYVQDTRSKDNVQGNGEDSIKGEWLTEAGLEVQHAKTMKMIANITI